MARDLSTFFRTWAQSVEVKAIQLRRSVAEVLELWSAGSAGLPMVTWNGITYMDYIYGLHMDYMWITYMDDYLYNQDIRQDSFFGAGMIRIQEVTLNEACSQGSKVFGPCFVSLAKASKAHRRGNIRIKYIEIITNHIKSWYTCGYLYYNYIYIIYRYRYILYNIQYTIHYVLMYTYVLNKCNQKTTPRDIGIFPFSYCLGLVRLVDSKCYLKVGKPTLRMPSKSSKLDGQYCCMFAPGPYFKHNVGTLECGCTKLNHWGLFYKKQQDSFVFKCGVWAWSWGSVQGLCFNTFFQSMDFKIGLEFKICIEWFCG